MAVAATYALGNLAFNSAANTHAIREQGGLDLVLKAMRDHVRAGCASDRRQHNLLLLLRLLLPVLASAD
jgi:hypothetical protein